MHGYAAAWLAIRMLFRPRHPVKLFGMTVWPQGMIPRHRQQLAETIGRAVGTELVSQETVVSAMFDDKFFERKVRSFVQNYTDDLLNTTYPSLLEALPAAARAPVLDAISALQRHAAEYLAGLLQSEETSRGVHEFISNRIDELLARRLKDTFDEAVFRHATEFIDHRFHDLACELAFEGKLRSFISDRFDELIRLHTPLSEMLAPEAISIVKERARAQIPPIVHNLAEIATSQRTRTQIGTLIKREVDDYYDQLSFFKKIFVSRDRIHHELDELVDETLPMRIEEYLHGEAFEEEAKRFLDDTIDDLLARPVSDVAGQITPDKLALIKDRISLHLIQLIRSPELRTTLAAYTTDALERLRPHSLRALLQLANPAAEDALKDFLSRALLGVIRHRETIRLASSIINREVERLLVKPIGRPTDYLSSESIERTAEVLTLRITDAARERLPATITEFDIGGIVRRKVSQFPAERLESLVLSIAQRHLRTIELFGLVIGFVIGVFQAFYIWYAR